MQDTKPRNSVHPSLHGTAFASRSSIKPALHDWLASATRVAAEKFGSVVEKNHASDALTCQSTNRQEQHMRGHHEELSAILPALALLIPFAGALWARVKPGRK
jgi:hypothetical protein